MLSRSPSEAPSEDTWLQGEEVKVLSHCWDTQYGYYAGAPGGIGGTHCPTHAVIWQAEAVQTPGESSVGGSLQRDWPWSGANTSSNG